MKSITVEVTDELHQNLEEYAKAIGLTRKGYGNNSQTGDVSKVVRLMLTDTVSNLTEFEKRRSQSIVDALRVDNKRKGK